MQASTKASINHDDTSFASFPLSLTGSLDMRLLGESEDCLSPLTHGITRAIPITTASMKNCKELRLLGSVDVDETDIRLECRGGLLASPGRKCGC